MKIPRKIPRRLAANCLLYDEFIVKEIHKGNITQEQFTFSLHIKLHGHCHQKSLASIEPSKECLLYLENYQVDIIPSGCCGMAGLSVMRKNIMHCPCRWETVIFPAVGKLKLKFVSLLLVRGCRQQIKGWYRQASLSSYRNLI